MQFELSILPIVYPFTEVALPSGSNDRKVVEVQVLLPAPSLKAFDYAALSVFYFEFSTNNRTEIGFPSDVFLHFVK